MRMPVELHMGLDLQSKSVVECFFLKEQSILWNKNTKKMLENKEKPLIFLEVSGTLLL